MVRLCILFTCLFLSSFSYAAEDIYFSDAEKALISLLLKTTQEVSHTQSNLLELDYKAQVFRLKQVIEKVKSYSQQEPEVIQVASFAEFLEKEKNSDLYAEYQLSEISDEILLEKIKPIRYESPSLRVQRKIESYEKLRLQKLQNFLALLGLKGLQLTQFQQESLEELRSNIQKAFNDQVERLTSELSQKNTAEVVVLSKLLNSYFKALPNFQKTEILYRISQMSLNASAIDVFLVMIQNAGPQLQKLVQIMGRSEQIPEEFKTIFQKIESQVKPVPWWKVKKILEANNINLNDFIYFEHKPIGVGTMAQTHRAQFRNKNGQRVSAVVRFLKPDIAMYLEMDHQILIKITKEIDEDPEIKKFNLPSLSDLVEDLHQSVVEELDLEATVKSQMKGRLNYSKSMLVSFNRQKNLIQFNVPQASLYKSSRHVMIQDLIIGKKPTKEFSEYKEIYPELYKVVSEKLAEMWIEEAFFRSGFFHADLHQGNILASYNEDSILIHILDFGMVGQLNKELRESTLLLGLAIQLSRADLIAENFYKLSKMNNPNLTIPKLLSLVKDRIKQLKNDPTLADSLEAWTAWALDQGLELQYEFLKLNRGMSAIEGLLSDSKSDLTLQKIARQVAFKNKAYVSGLLLRRSKFSLADYAQLTFKIFDKEPAALTNRLQCRSLFE